MASSKPSTRRPSGPKSSGGNAGGTSSARKSAQQRLLDQRAAAAADRVATTRRKKAVAAIVPVVLVVIVVAALIVAKVATGGSDKTSGTKASAAADAVISQITSIPQATFDQIGIGSVTTFPVSSGGAPALTTGSGLPRVFYAGAEYCPFCAAERWAVVVAMSRFGTWTGLGQTASAPKDVYPNTATLTFHGASFTATAVAFNGYELQSNQVVNGQYATLETLSSADQALMAKYDAAPYFSSTGSIPFIDIGGKYLISGAAYDPQLLAGKTQAQIAAAIADPSTAISKAVIGEANVITAAVCSITKNAPPAVCTSAGVTAAAAKLPSGT